ncbi:MAG: hypothetical protein WDW36_005573 [Sanguina aurantia]
MASKHMSEFDQPHSGANGLTEAAVASRVQQQQQGDEPGHPSQPRQPANHPSRAPAERRLSVGSTYSRATEAYAPPSSLLGSTRPRPHKIWKKKYIKVMVVGDSGLGKTTLIKSLISIPGERVQVHDGSHTPVSQFSRDPESLCSTISWRDEEDRCIWVYRIQDTPGYGDELDVYKNLGMIIEFLNVQDQKWLQLEQSRDRKEDLSELEDPRVDLCLFCIPPHRLRPLDLKYMYELGLHVPIVPIVTKADTMTIREANVYRQEVANKIANPMLPGIKDKINVFKFERDTLERSGIVDQAQTLPPLPDPPLYWPERRYPWGTAEAFNREHSDLLSLRSLLLKEALEEINKLKRSRYETWRRKTLAGSKIVPRFMRLLVATVIPALVCLQAGRSGIKISDIRRVVSNTVKSAEKAVKKVQELTKRGPGSAPSVAAPAARSQSANAVSLMLSHPVEAEPEQQEAYQEPEPAAVYVPAAAAAAPAQARVQAQPEPVKKGWGVF